MFDKRCNELESWLMARGYSAKLVRQKVLEARKFSRNELLDKVKVEKGFRLTLNITYHPAFSKLKHILNSIHVLLAPNTEHQNVFPEVPLVGFKKGKSLKDILVRAKVRKEVLEKGFSKGCGGKRCQVCKYVKDSESFESKLGQSFKIKGENNCNSKMIVYLVNCKCCQKQYVGSTSTKFRLRFNNYKSCHTSLNKPVPQESFHAHFKEQSHKGMDDW